MTNEQHNALIKSGWKHIDTTGGVCRGCGYQMHDYRWRSPKGTDYHEDCALKTKLAQRTLKQVQP